MTFIGSETRSFSRSMGLFGGETWVLFHVFKFTELSEYTCVW